jgi:hypothetical protein
MNPRLQSIFNKYYTENPKDFIDLIEIISENGLDKIENIIKELEKISPLVIDTGKIKLLVNRNTEAALSKKKDETTDIEIHSRNILNQYASILNNSSVAFKKEVTII